MEIRRIEGIIPVEAISRDLPIKLENFSYHDMKRLLSQVAGGEFKGDKAQEFENLLLKAIFLEYLPQGKAKIKIGDFVLTARIEVDKEFSPGQEILLRLESLYPEVELKLVEDSVHQLFARTLPKLFRFNGELLKLVFNNAYVQQTILTAVKQFIPELSNRIENFFKKGEFLPSKELLVALLILLKPEVYEKVKKSLPKDLSYEKLKELLEVVVSGLLLFSTTKVLILPVLEEGFRGRVFFGEYDGVSVALIEGTTSLGEFYALVRALGNSISVELSGDSRLLEKVDVEELKGLLKEEGLNPLVVEKVGLEKILGVKGKVLKGNLLDFSA